MIRVGNMGNLADVLMVSAFVCLLPLMGCVAYIYVFGLMMGYWHEKA